MKRAWFYLLLALIPTIPVVAIYSQPMPPTAGPVPPTKGDEIILPVAKTKLTAGVLYVFHSNAPMVGFAGQNASLVKVMEVPAGPRPFTLYGKFIDGSGDYEFKELASKNIYIVHALGAGKAEIVAVPLNATTKAADVRRQTIDVDAGGGSKPPPVDPPTTVLKHVTYIGGEISQVATDIAKDVGLMALFKDAGTEVWMMRANDPMIAVKGLTKAVTKAGGAPCFIFQDESGNVIGQGSMSSVAFVREIATQFIGRKQ